ncbi:hypothetical protein N8T08_008488 [Aspergillus melleus]|uniref:Uncharacterized protein n=1 Tax=Aspergillus melleus TaxID=138277 RepID=A0ACC3AV79_9EURO|nr:hypothetical protein N8T08_008488 [Aspergillus melleus]
MKPLHYLLCILALVVGLHAADPDFNKFPSCASSYRDNLLSSVNLNCTTKEEFITKRLSAQVCGIEQRKGPAAIDGSTLAPFILGALFFIIRIGAKSLGLAGGWGWDDYTIIVSFMLGLAMYVLNIYMIRLGFGRDIWDIPFDTITKFYKCFEALAVMYKVQISLAKISVCLFLLRIFQSRSFRYSAYILIGLNASIGITWALVDSLRCIPPHLDWTGWMNEEEEGQCINFIDAVLVNCLVNIIVDTALIIMPVYEVSKLQLPLRKKLTVGLMFVMGSVLTIIAIIRVVVFWNNRWAENETYGLYPLMHWSVIECQISVMCACLPASRALISHFFPGILGNSTRRTYGTGPSNWYNKEPSQGNSKIAKSVSYSVNYAPRSHQDDTTSMVELMEVEGAARYAQ